MANPESGSVQPGRIYCSEHNDGEVLCGTADTVDVWLCLEYRPTWKARVLADNALSAGVRSWLQRTLSQFEAAGLKCRSQFVRQPEIESDSVRLLLIHAGATYQWSGAGYGYLEDLDLADLVTTDGALASATERLREPQYLVCTNGQRDVCCARFGLPLYAALRERVSDRAWQVTHLGGHRFAPNLLTLPDACLYGRVTPEDLDGFLARTEQGAVDFEHLRGRTCYTPVVQAAEALLGRDGVRLLHVEEREGSTRVRFAADDGTAHMDVRRAAEPLRVLKSCQDEEEAEVYPYVRG